MTAVILAGGRGTRMRADKAGLTVGDRTLLEHVVAQLVPCFDDILISVSPGQKIGATKARRERAGTRGKGPTREEERSRPGPGRGVRGPGIVVDEVPGLGPIGGLLTGLKASPNEAAAVVACDIPDIDIPLLRSLARAAGSADIAVPVDPAGRFEPLFAVYKKAVIPAVETLLGSGERSLLPLYERCRTTAVRIEERRRLTNLNTRAEYLEYLKSPRRK